MSVTITPEMTKAGYLAVQKVAQDNGYGWSFDMVSESTVDDAMTQVFNAMVAAAPPSWPTRLKTAIKARIKRFAEKLEV
jgi:hypothetical protein